MRTTTLKYASTDGSSQVRALLWEPDDEGAQLRGIVQIAHGMAEHIERYIPFAEYLVGKGFAVCGNDHVGHGQSVSDDSQLGHITLSGGASVLVEDVHQLRQLVQERIGEQVPYVLFGHSMGSFVARVYIERHGEGLAAAIICGTGQTPRALSSFGRTLAGALAAIHGETYRSKLIDNMGVGAYSKAVKDAKTPLDWLSHNRKNVDDYIADPLCGFMFTVGGYSALLSLTYEAADPAATENVPKGLPLLFIAGAEDPVGDAGEGVLKAVEQYKRAGIKTVDVTLYANMRHEILNEDDRIRVCDDVAAWLEKQGL